MKVFNRTKIFVLIFASILVLLPITRNVDAQTADEIQEEIEKQQDELNKTKDEISKLEDDIKNSEAALEGLADGIPKFEAELVKINKELELTQKKLQQLEEENKLKELEKKKAIEDQRGALNTSYHSWRLKNSNILNQVNVDARMNNMSEYFAQKVLQESDKDIRILVSEIATLEGDITDNNDLVAELEKAKNDVEKKKKELEDQIAYYNSVISYGGNQIVNLETRVHEISQSISTLSAAQQEALRIQAEIIAQSGGGGASVGGCGIYDDVNLNNTITLCGLGNDFQQGHGVGLSQFGAYGMANNNPNLSAEDIIQFYYTGVSVQGGFQNRTVNVQGYGNMNIEDYAAGIAEIPNKACGNAQQIAERPDKYTSFNGNIWSCWPESTIRAKVILARTYAIFHGSVCVSAACQVYVGGEGKRWAVEETEGKVVLYNGQPIDAVYSSDNNQGFGTANNDTIWQNYHGDGDAYPYLRSVNDTSFAYRTSWSNWGYKTNSYTMSDINKMLNYVADNPGRFGSGFSSHAQWMRSQLGGKNKVAKLTFDRDPSKRVRKVYFHSQEGSNAVMGGYWFTYMWNLYTVDHGIYNGNGAKDWLWSQTFFLHIV